MSVPSEFSKSYVESNSPVEEQLYTEFLKSREPYKSLSRRNFHQFAKDGFSLDPRIIGETGPTPGLDLEDDEVYYNTSGAAAEYWRDKNLPRPVKDISTLRKDLKQWGYCLIQEGLSAAQYESMKKRLVEQAEGERKAGVANWMGTAPIPGQAISNTQFLHALINKGEQFVQCVEHDPKGVQAGAVIEQLLSETMGADFLMSSFIAIVSNPNNMPQGLHQDQATAPFQDSVAPYTVNTMFIMENMTAQNGGTLVVPGSHKILSKAGSGGAIKEPLPPAISLEAPAGTVMIFEGRLLHGTGVNRSNGSRIICVMNSIKPFMRQQELHMLSAKKEILKKGSRKFLYRIGARPTGLGGIEGAWNGDFLVNQRLMLEEGGYLPVGQLSPDMPVEVLSQNFGYRYSEVGLSQSMHQPETESSVQELYADVIPTWQPPSKNPQS